MVTHTCEAGASVLSTGHALHVCTQLHTSPDEHRNSRGALAPATLLGGAGEWGKKAPPLCPGQGGVTGLLAQGSPVLKTCWRLLGAPVKGGVA